MASKVKLTEAESVVLGALCTLPENCFQRIDGLRCERDVIRLSGLSFEWAMFKLRLRSLIEHRTFRQFWPSCQGMKSWRATTAGRVHLASSGKTSGE